MDRFHRALLVAGLFLLAMTRSGSGDKVQKSKIGFAECKAFRRSQWTTLPHPDMQCRVFILRRADSSMPQPQMPAIAQANVGMTWLLEPPAS